MIDDLALILASVGTATGTVALLRRRARRARPAWPDPVDVGTRHLADALCATAAEPLTVAASTWKSLAETIEPRSSGRLDEGQ